MKKKYNVVTMGSRDYYQVSISLFEKDCLGYLLTDFYAGNLLSKFTKKRHSNELKYKNIISLLPFFVFQKILISIKAPLKFQRFVVDFLFGFVAAAITRLTYNRAIVYSYHIEGFVAFYRLIGKRPSNLICFQVHPSPWYISEIIKKDLVKASAIGFNKFDNDIESSYDISSMKRYISALNFCNSIVCASSFTARSIRDDLSPTIKIGIVPYGSKLETIVGIKKNDATKIRLVTVCQLSQRKGMHWAFEAMKQSGLTSKFEWIIVSNSKDASIVSHAPSNVRFINKLSDEDLSELLLNSDLFVMPSLVEGFGLVYIESLSKGLPIVYTDNTGANDFCINGIHGFKVRPGCIDDLISIFQNISDGSINIKQMRNDCLRLSESINWNKFRQDFYKLILSGSGRAV